MGVHDDEPRSVEWVSGACMLVRRAVISEIGPIPEDWFMYSEDLEWCRRITQGGWEIWHDPEAVVSHVLGGTQDGARGVSTVWVTTFRHHFRRLNAPSKPERLLFDAILGGGLLTRALWYLCLGIANAADRRLWMRESRRFFYYARSAWGPLSNA
jgi:GT2 family glycosyltransferase